MATSNGGLRNMTEGSPARHIVLFALPLLAGSFLQQLYNMVDSWVVGQYVGDAALAAVGIGFPVIFMFTSLFMGLANGGTVVIAQFYGAGELDRVRDAVDTIYTAFTFSAVPVTLLAVGLVKPILFLLRVDDAAYDDAWLYLTVVCAGLIGTIGYNLNAGILGGLGNSSTTLRFLAVAALLNIALDLILVLVCGWGVFGVAIATVVSQAFSWLYGLWYINRRYPQIAIRPFCRRFDRSLFGQIMGIGLPAGIQMSLVALGAMVVMSKINTFGRITVADQQRGRSRGHHAGSHDTYLTLRHSRSSSDWYKIPSLYHTIRRRSNGIFHIDLWKTRRCRRVFHSKCRFWPADQYILPGLPYRLGAFSHKSALSPIWSRSPADSSSSRARTSAGTCVS